MNVYLVTYTVTKRRRTKTYSHTCEAKSAREARSKNSTDGRKVLKVERLW